MMIKAGDTSSVILFGVLIPIRKKVCFLANILHSPSFPPISLAKMFSYFDSSCSRLYSNQAVSYLIGVFPQLGFLPVLEATKPSFL